VPALSGEKGVPDLPQLRASNVEARGKILKERDFFFVVRHTGAYYDRCLKLIFNEAQARLLGICAEE
jgi:hypothetical protein